jgi:ADP-ribose pyrophosphatase
MTLPDTHAKLVSSRRAFDGFYAIDIVEVQPRSMRDGSLLPQMQRDMFRTRTAAAVVLYNPDADEILLSRQFRTGPWLRGEDPFLLECAAGIMDKNETPEQTACRECREETGCEVEHLEPVAISYPSPGCMDEIIHIFAGCYRQATAGFHGLAGEGEEIETTVLPATQVIAMLDAGKIRNGTALIALQWFARHHARLKKEWARQ